MLWYRQRSEPKRINQFISAGTHLEQNREFEPQFAVFQTDSLQSTTVFPQLG